MSVVVAFFIGMLIGAIVGACVMVFIAGIS